MVTSGVFDDVIKCNKKQGKLEKNTEFNTKPTYAFLHIKYNFENSKLIYWN